MSRQITHKLTNYFFAVAKRLHDFRWREAGGVLRYVSVTSLCLSPSPFLLFLHPIVFTTTLSFPSSVFSFSTLVHLPRHHQHIFDHAFLQSLIVRHVGVDRQRLTPPSQYARERRPHKRHSRHRETDAQLGLPGLPDRAGIRQSHTTGMEDDRKAVEQISSRLCY